MNLAYALTLLTLLFGLLIHGHFLSKNFLSPDSISTNAIRIFQSPSEYAKNLIPLFMIFSFVLLALALIYRQMNSSE